MLEIILTTQPQYNPSWFVILCFIPIIYMLFSGEEKKEEYKKMFVVINRPIRDIGKRIAGVLTSVFEGEFVFEDNEVKEQHKENRSGDGLFAGILLTLLLFGVYLWIITQPSGGVMLLIEHSIILALLIFVPSIVGGIMGRRLKYQYTETQRRCDIRAESTQTIIGFDIDTAEQFSLYKHFKQEFPDAEYTAVCQRYIKNMDIKESVK